MQRGKILIGILVVFGLVSVGFSSVCECSSASECNAKIADPSCSVIKLTNDISGQITFNDVYNKVLDGQGHSIVSDTVGIIIDGTDTNITITDCNIIGKDVGISLYGTNNKIIINNSNITGKYVGIWFFMYTTNRNITISNCNIFSEQRGIVFYYYSDNKNIYIK